MRAGSVAFAAHEVVEHAVVAEILVEQVHRHRLADILVVVGGNRARARAAAGRPADAGRPRRGGRRERRGRVRAGARRRARPDAESADRVVRPAGRVRVLEPRFGSEALLISLLTRNSESA